MKRFNGKTLILVAYTICIILTKSQQTLCKMRKNIKLNKTNTQLCKKHMHAVEELNCGRMIVVII